MRALPRLLPRSLFGRLVLVLLVGLGLAQLATGYINLAERGQLLYRAGGMRLAQRIADIAKLLDSVPRDERRRIAAVFNAPPLVVSLDKRPVADAGERATMFATVLRYALGDALKLKVIAHEAPPPEFRRRERFAPPDMPMMAHGMGPYGRDRYGMHDFEPHGAFYTVQIELHDGTWATFETHLSPQATAVPVRLGLILLILLGTVIVLSLVAVRWATRPLSALATAAVLLGEDINRAPLPESGPLEVQRAARAFNTMQRRLSHFISERTRVLIAMSHDLKTPITRLRLRAEMLDDAGAQSRFLRDLDEMESMVAQTLEFMRDASASEPLQRVDLMALIESLQTDYRDTGREVEIEGAITAPYTGRPMALRRCISNLVENAIRYGQRATIRVEDGAQQIKLRVLDRGPGMPEAELERAFEPFFRGEESRSRETGGTGLGLGIARNIARAHGGDVVLRNGVRGGLEATVTLARSARG